MTYFTNWDRRHVFNVIGNYNINKKWDLNWKWTYQSGQAFTPILGYFLEDLDYGVSGVGTIKFRTIPGDRNSGRYPPFHRLDFSVVRHIQSKRFEKVDLYFQVINAYDRQNIFRYAYNSGSAFNGLDDDGDWDVKSHDTNGNGTPDPGEPNVDEPDEGKVTRNEISVFPLIPTIGISIDF